MNVPEGLKLSENEIVPEGPSSSVEDALVEAEDSVELVPEYDSVVDSSNESVTDALVLVFPVSSVEVSLVTSIAVSTVVASSVAEVLTTIPSCKNNLILW